MEVFGGIKAESLLVKTEEPDDKSNIVEIGAQDILGGLEQLEENVSDNEIKTKNLQDGGKQNIGNTEADTRQILQGPALVIYLKNVNEAAPKKKDKVQEKLILNYINEDPPNARRRTRSSQKKGKNNNNTENKSKEKEIKKKKTFNKDTRFILPKPVENSFLISEPAETIRNMQDKSKKIALNEVSLEADKNIYNNNEKEIEGKETPKKISLNKCKKDVLPKSRKRHINWYRPTITQNEYSLEKDKKYRCNHCQALMKSKKQTGKHIRHTHRDASIFQHREESLKKLSATVRSSHVAWYEYTYKGDCRYCCSHCKEIIEGQPEVEKHIRSKHRTTDERKWTKCPYCPYQTPFDLRSHLLYNHTKEEDIEYYRCDKCDFKCKRKHGIRRHILGQHLDPHLVPGRVNRCPQCPKVFFKNESLQKHLSVIHGNEANNKLKCFHCIYECKTKQSMEHHMQSRHTNCEYLENLQCPQCPFKTKYNMMMKAHVHTTHTNIFQCHICSYHSTLKTNLSLHLISHKKNKDEIDLKYCCDKCDYKTYRSYSLQVHKLNHLKPEEIQYFYCNHCKFKAKRKDNLKAHILRHFIQNEVQFACYICDFITRKRHLLVRHIDQHSKEANNEKNVKKETKRKGEDMKASKEELKVEA